MQLDDLKPGISVEDRKIPGFVNAGQGRYIYFLAGVHGDEIEGIYVLQQLLNYIINHDELDFPLVVIPILNVDGYNAGSRQNAQGVDLNRNLYANWVKEYSSPEYNPGSEPCSEPENKYLVSLFEKYPPGFIISFHTWKPMLNFNGDCEDVAMFLNNYNGYEVIGEIPNYPTPGSLGYYAPLQYHAPVLTFEMPKLTEGLSLKDIWDQNKQGLVDLVNSKLINRFIS